MSDNDIESSLRERFAELRSLEQRRVPDFARTTEVRPPRHVGRLRVVALVMVLIGAVLAGGRWGLRYAEERERQRTVAAAPFMASPVWHSPTDSLLSTPENDLLATVPRIGYRSNPPRQPRTLIKGTTS